MQNGHVQCWGKVCANLCPHLRTGPCPSPGYKGRGPWRLPRHPPLDETVVPMFPELPVRHKSVLTMALTVGCALAALARCGSSASSRPPEAPPVAVPPAPARRPRAETSSLPTRRTRVAERVNVFDNNSIWIMEQITQPLFTVTNNGKGVMPWLATGYTESKNRLAYTITLRQGVKFSNEAPDDVQGRRVQPGADDGRRPGLGLHRLRHKVGGRPVPRDGGGQPEIQVGAHPGRPGAVR